MNNASEVPGFDSSRNVTTRIGAVSIIWAMALLVEIASL